MHVKIAIRVLHMIKNLGAGLIQWLWNTIADLILVHDKQDGKTNAAQNLPSRWWDTARKPRPSATAHTSMSKTRMCGLSMRVNRDPQKSSSERQTMPTFSLRYSNHLKFYYESKVMCNYVIDENDKIIFYPFTSDELRLRIYASNIIW